jgi:hypothetical protein
MEAQEFKRYLRDNPYFQMVVDELNEEYMTQILGLRPQDKETFTVLQAVRMSFLLPFERVDADIQMGNDATERLTRPDNEYTEGEIL